MLIKLYKHDLRTVMPKMLSVYLVLLGTALAAGLAMSSLMGYPVPMLYTPHAQNGHAYAHISKVETMSAELSYNISGGAFTGLIMLVYTALIMAVTVLTLLTIITHYYNDLFTGRGYLMHTLPVSPWQHVLAKLLSAITVTVCSVAVLLLSTGVVGVVGKIFVQTESLGFTLFTFFDILQRNMRSGEIAFGLLHSLVQWITVILVVYLAIMLGRLFPRFRVPASIVSFFVLSGVEQTLRNLMFFASIPEGAVQSTRMVYNVSSLLYEVVLGAGYFAACCWLMKNRLELE